MSAAPDKLKRPLDRALMWTAVVAILVEGAAIHLLVSSRSLPLALGLDAVTLIAIGWLIVSQAKLRSQNRRAHESGQA